MNLLNPMNWEINCKKYVDLLRCIRKKELDFSSEEALIQVSLKLDGLLSYLYGEFASSASEEAEYFLKRKVQLKKNMKNKEYVLYLVRMFSEVSPRSLERYLRSYLDECEEEFLMNILGIHWKYCCHFLNDDSYYYEFLETLK